MVMMGCCFVIERDALLRGVSGFGIGEVELSTFDVLQMFVFFLQMGFTLILATLDGLDVCLLGDVIGEDDGDEDGIHKGYERFQSLLSQLEIHGAYVSTEDANQKFLRSLPFAWLQVSLIMRNKPGMDSLSFHDFGNDLHENKDSSKRKTGRKATVVDAKDNPHRNLQNKGIIDSGCSRHMTGNKAYLADFQDINGGPVAFGGSKGYITGKGKIKTGGLACLIAKATTDESNLWHRRDQEGIQQCQNSTTKLEYAEERIRTLLRQQGPCSGSSFFYLTLFGRKQLVLIAYVLNSDISEALDDESWVDAHAEVLLTVSEIEKGFVPFSMARLIEEVFVSQPQVIQRSLKYSSEVYKVVKALVMGLHQLQGACVKTASTPIETQKPLVKDEEANDVDSVLVLDSDYAGANLDRKSTTGGCQFLGRRLITWQCKKQTIVATSTTEAEYVAAASCCGQVLWIQNQMLDYGFNFMNTKIYIDNESTICIVKNPVYHSKTKHIAIRHHFIRDAYEKKLIQVLKIHTNDNVADLLTKAFDGKHFSGKITPLFDNMLVQPTPSPEPTSEAPNESLPDSSSAQSSEVPFEQQPDHSPSPSPRPSPNPSPTPNIPDSIPEHTGENLGDHSFNDTSLSGNEDAMTLQNVYDLCISLCKQVSDQAKEIKLLKAKITKLK
ncbi:hypothetical protein Tco_1449038, partial [Tanacetum coccineum]